MFAVGPVQVGLVSDAKVAVRLNVSLYQRHWHARCDDRPHADPEGAHRPIVGTRAGESAWTDRRYDGKDRGPHGPIGEWDVSSVTDMAGGSDHTSTAAAAAVRMDRSGGGTRQATSFNGEISKWHRTQRWQQ